MDRVALFVDGANFFYMQKNDLNWFVDTKKLMAYCERFGEVVDAYYYIGKDSPPAAEQQAYLSALAYMGYALVTKPIKTIYDSVGGKFIQKANLDIDIVLDMFSTIENYDVAVLVSGDGDFDRALRILRARGKRFKVIASPRFVASELRDVAGMHLIDMESIRAEIEKK
ncbi:MAG: NYN domain-containing protein [Clostridiales bacterium]|nr:NYN domain-containing protein [Clostridiales bacterium]